MLPYKEAVCVDVAMFMGQMMQSNVILAKTDNMVLIHE